MELNPTCADYDGQRVHIQHTFRVALPRVLLARGQKPRGRGPKQERPGGTRRSPRHTHTAIPPYLVITPHNMVVVSVVGHVLGALES